jgi:hypothetical protein
MQNQKEITKISHFLAMVSPIIAGIVKTIIQSIGCEISQKGNGFNLIFSIKAGEKHMEFYLHNLFMEIATVDRDENPIRFDNNLQDFDYFLAKMARVIQSKLNVLFKLLAEENPDIALEKITQMAKDYERIRIWKFDKTIE